MRSDEQRPEQQPEQISDLPTPDATDAADAADQIKGGATTVSNLQQQTSDAKKNIISNTK